MGLFSKILKAPLKLHKKALKVAKKTTPGLGGSGGKHKKAGLRSGGAKAAARNARATAGPRLSASGQGNARRAIANNVKYRKK